MAWTTPMTATAGAFNAADWNTHVRDNLLETAPGKATAAGQWFVASGSHAIAAREIKKSYVDDEVTRSTTSFGDLSGSAGPAVTITTGTLVIVSMTVRIGNDTTNAASQCTYNISGATSFTGDETVGIISDGLQGATTDDNIRTIGVSHAKTVTAGSNTFTMKYKAVSGTARFAHRTLVVWAF